MIEFMMFMLNIAWKILGLCFGIMLFKYVMKNGTGTFRSILDTVSMALKAAGHWIRKRLYIYLKKEAEEASKETKVEGTVE